MVSDSLQDDIGLKMKYDSCFISSAQRSNHGFPRGALGCRPISHGVDNLTRLIMPTNAYNSQLDENGAVIIDSRHGRNEYVIRLIHP